MRGARLSPYWFLVVSRRRYTEEKGDTPILLPGITVCLMAPKGPCGRTLGRVMLQLIADVPQCLLPLKEMKACGTRFYTVDADSTFRSSC